MNVINYNPKKYRELLNHQKNVLAQGKSFFNEKKAEFLELSQYSAAVDQHIFWENRFEVASLIQTFLNKQISAEEFHDNVFGLRRNHINKCNKFLLKLVSGEIKEFFPNKKAHKLEGFLSFLYFECEHFEMDWDEETFYNSIQNGFLKFQTILNEE